VVTVVVSVLLPVVFVFGLGHRGEHMARGLLLPGAGLVDERLVLAIGLFLGFVAATVVWLAWGVDWLVGATFLASVGLSGALTSAEVHDTAESLAAVPTLVPRLGAHEFPVVVLVVAALAWVRTVTGRVPGLRWLTTRRTRRRAGGDGTDALDAVDGLAPVDRSRTAAVLALVPGEPSPGRAERIATDDGVRRRAARVGLVARGRLGGDPVRVDHAHARAALSLTGALDAAATERFVADGARSLLGVPCSEPGWIRPLDGMLAAVALHRVGGDVSAWRRAMRAELGLRRGHRPDRWWTPLGIGAGSMPAWEQAASTGIARALGWVDDADWTALRRRALGASARGTTHPHDERLIAAARIWLAQVDDPEAARLLARPTVRHDPLAVALDTLARALTCEPALLRTAGPEQRTGPSTAPP
jgi:hypothetical protein